MGAGMSTSVVVVDWTSRVLAVVFGGAGLVLAVLAAVVDFPSQLRMIGGAGAAAVLAMLGVRIWSRRLLIRGNEVHVRNMWHQYRFGTGDVAAVNLVTRPFDRWTMDIVLASGESIRCGAVGPQFKGEAGRGRHVERVSKLAEVLLGAGRRFDVIGHSELDRRRNARMQTIVSVVFAVMTVLYLLLDNALTERVAGGALGVGVAAAFFLTRNRMWYPPRGRR